MDVKFRASFTPELLVFTIPENYNIKTLIAKFDDARGLIRNIKLKIDKHETRKNGYEIQKVKQFHDY